MKIVPILERDVASRIAFAAALHSLFQTQRPLPHLRGASAAVYFLPAKP
jgi:hypothetical protein